MTNIIKETLEKTFNELKEQIQHHEALRRAHLTNEANHIALSIDDLFKEFTIQVTDRTIEFKYTENSWYDFRIERKQTYKSDGYEYGKASVSTSSVSDADNKNLMKLICLGKLAKHCFINTKEWNGLVSLMDRSNEIYKANIGPLNKQIYQIEDQLRKIAAEERSIEFNKIFNKNTFKLNRPISYYYGNGKWDRVYSNEFFWEANESGKTYTVSYTDERRTNPRFDENGNELEAITELVKRTIDKRIKKADIESFVRQHMNLIEQ
jgi:hypothetical protein